MAMLRSSTTAMMAALWIFVASATSQTLAAPTPGGSDAIETARRRIDRNDARGAVDILESALASAKGKDRTAFIEPLRAAYTAAIHQAEGEGKTADAAGFRDDLDILSRKSKAASNVPPPTATAPAPKSAPETVPALPAAQPDPILPLAEPAPIEAPAKPSQPEKTKDAPGSVSLSPAPLFQNDDAPTDTAVKPAATPVDAPVVKPTPAAVPEPCAGRTSGSNGRTGRRSVCRQTI